jgi:hypothetical protein
MNSLLTILDHKTHYHNVGKLPSNCGVSFVSTPNEQKREGFGVMSINDIALEVWGFENLR